MVGSSKQDDGNGKDPVSVAVAVCCPAAGFLMISEESKGWDAGKTVNERHESRRGVLASDGLPPPASCKAGSQCPASLSWWRQRHRNLVTSVSWPPLSAWLREDPASG
jgi:hypothetical protein